MQLSVIIRYVAVSLAPQHNIILQNLTLFLLEFLLGEVPEHKRVLLDISNRFHSVVSIMRFVGIVCHHNVFEKAPHMFS